MKKVLPWLNLLAHIGMVTVNGLANALPINGKTTGDISDQFATYFVPAGYVFSIWGLIYLALTGFVIYQLLPAQRDNPRLQRIGPWFIISSLANSAWIFFWHYELFPLTLVAMLVLLASLIVIYLRLEIGRVRVPIAEKALLHIPFSIYLGWITVATVANVTQLLYYLEWGGWGISPQAWAVIMLIAATAIAAAVSLTRGDVAYMLVLIWAFVGIAVRHADTTSVAVTAWVTTGLLVVALVAGALWQRRLQDAAA